MLLQLHSEKILEVITMEKTILFGFALVAMAMVFLAGCASSEPTEGAKDSAVVEKESAVQEVQPPEPDGSLDNGSEKDLYQLEEIIQSDVPPLPELDDSYESPV